MCEFNIELQNFKANAITDKRKLKMTIFSGIAKQTFYIIIPILKWQLMQ